MIHSHQSWAASCSNGKYAHRLIPPIGSATPSLGSVCHIASTLTLFTRPHPDANDVHVTGTFDDWGKTEKLNKVGDIWEKEVKLPQADKKILYKFVVNDNWVIDPEAPQEDDGHGNLNNVLYPDQIKTKSTDVTTSSAAPQSTTAAMAGQVPLEPRKEATEGESNEARLVITMQRTLTLFRS